jgi:hypothetical protein
MRRLSFAIAAFVALAAFHCASFQEGADAPIAGGPDGATDGPPSSGGGDAGDEASCGTPDFATDRKHCGRCNHSCAGGDCVGGVCQPFLLMKAAAVGEIARSGTRIFVEVPTPQGKSTIVACPRNGCGSSPEPVIDEIADVRSMIFTDGRLYFTTYDSASAVNTLESCEPTSCKSTLVPVIEPLGGSAVPSFTPLRVLDGKVTFGQLIAWEGELRRFTNGAVEPLAKTACVPTRIAVSASALTWLCLGGASTYSCDVPCTIDGGTADDVDPKSIGQIERSGAHLVREDGSNGNLTIRSPQGETVLPPRGTGPIAVSNADLFFQNGLMDRIETCQLPTCATKQTLATSTAGAAAIVADIDGVFWTVPTLNVVMSVAR